MGHCCAKAVDSSRPERDINTRSENPLNIESARCRIRSTENPVDIELMLALPVDVICGGILPYLSVCDLQALDTAFTNKYLRPQLHQVWKCYQYDSLDVELEEDELFWLSGKSVRIISFAVVEDDISEADFSAINTSTVKRLRVTSHIAASCPNLEELYLGQVYESNIDDIVAALAQNCRQLHTLQISSEYLSDAGITNLARYCPKLILLLVDGARIAYAGIQALCDNCPHLKHIGFSHCRYVTGTSLRAIADTYPYLQSFYLHSKRFTDVGLIYFADKCHELRSVSVRCKHITSRGLTALWTANPNLMDVNISHHRFISDDDIIQLVQCCPLLQKLNISYCRQITDGAVIAVAEHCPQLRSLNISGCYGMSDDLSDASLIALGQHCHELKSIDISCLDYISDVGIAALAVGCPLLQEFTASGTNITDAGVVALARGCRDLRKLALDHVLSIGVAAISAIAENCPLISELQVSRGKIDDACLYVIAQHCCNLIKLNIWSTRVSDVDAVMSVLKSCRMLREIDCRYCFKEELDTRAIRNHPRVEVLV